VTEAILAHPKHAAPPGSPKERDPLADKWLKKIKNNWLIAAVIVAGTIILAIVEFGQKTSEFYEKHVKVPVSLEALNLSSTSDMYFEEQSMRCALKDNPVRTFLAPASIKENRAVSLDFVFSNKAQSDAIFKSVDFDVNAAEQVAGGAPGIVVPNHTYVVDLKHQVGMQSFPLVPVYKVPGNDTGSFTIVFKPATEGVGLCWIMKAVFHTNLGDVKSDDFSVIMSNFKR
jgi:hypothetical protein